MTLIASAAASFSRVRACVRVRARAPAHTHNKEGDFVCRLLQPEQEREQRAAAAATPTSCSGPSSTPAQGAGVGAGANAADATFGERARFLMASGAGCAWSRTRATRSRPCSNNSSTKALSFSSVRRKTHASPFKLLLQVEQSCQRHAGLGVRSRRQELHVYKRDPCWVGDFCGVLTGVGPVQELTQRGYQGVCLFWPLHAVQTSVTS